MYKYDAHDQTFVRERVRQFRSQVGRWRAGALSDDEFKPLRLQNGLYLQRHAPMLRIAVPYGLVSSRQLRALADIAHRFDRGYGHFTTRQNIQFNWVEIDQVPDILDILAGVDMHAIQTSGNCIRNVTSDAFAGVAADEIVNPQPFCEILRQWSTFHPEFAYLPRKFKLAVNGAANDRAAVQMHDIGLDVCRGDPVLNGGQPGETGFRVWVGGGLGRTPILGQVLCEYLPWPHLLTYIEAILRVYNRYGRRDNAYKARIKILVQALGIEAFKTEVEAEWAHLKGGPGTLTQEEIARVHARFTAPDYEALPQNDESFAEALKNNPAFSRWAQRNVSAHRQPGYAIVTLSLKKHGHAPGDITAGQLERVADLADRYSHGEVRVTHEQNLVLADVRQSDLFTLWESLRAFGFATPNIGLLTNIVCCPGGDFCDLANAKSIPIATAVQARFDDLDYLFDIGEIDLNISGCINSCSHHHLGHIGVLGVDKNDEEWYQVTLGGAQGKQARLGKVIGPSFPAVEIPDVVEKLIRVYLREREDESERFIDTVERIGAVPFKIEAYGQKAGEKALRRPDARPGDARLAE